MTLSVFDGDVGNSRKNCHPTSFGGFNDSCLYSPRHLVEDWLSILTRICFFNGWQKKNTYRTSVYALLISG